MYFWKDLKYRSIFRRYIFRKRNLTASVILSPKTVHFPCGISVTAPSHHHILPNLSYSKLNKQHRDKVRNISTPERAAESTAKLSGSTLRGHGYYLPDADSDRLSYPTAGFENLLYTQVTKGQIQEKEAKGWGSRPVSQFWNLKLSARSVKTLPSKCSLAGPCFNPAPPSTLCHPHPAHPWD